MLCGVDRHLGHVQCVDLGRYLFAIISLCYQITYSRCDPRIFAIQSCVRDYGLSVYDSKPGNFLTEIVPHSAGSIATTAYCANFELGQWRCKPFAFHLLEWLPDYALPEEELQVNHANSLLKINQAAVRVYTSPKYAKRGEAGEIALHAVCREFFGTIPISPRVFYKSASNDVVKAFDMVHARLPEDAPIEIWLGESKLYEDGGAAIASAIASIRSHIDAGFLTNEKLLLGPQVPKSTPRYEEVIAIFNKQATLDQLLTQAVFVVGILCNSGSAKKATKHDSVYLAGANAELRALCQSLANSGLATAIKLELIYIPLADKAALVAEFDARLKGLQ